MFYKRQCQENKMTSHTDLEKIFARDLSDKALLSKIYKEFLKLINKRNCPIKK